LEGKIFEGYIRDKKINTLKLRNEKLRNWILAIATGLLGLEAIIQVYQFFYR
jgi:hypothetical protein